ncbi:MAG: tetratricopeptide repeat protein, partial [Planctomycetota bacterium]
MRDDIEKLLIAFRGNPENENHFNALKQHYFLSRDWEGLVKMYETRAGFTRDPHLSATSFFEAASIIEKRLGNPERRLQVLRAAFRASPKFKPAAKELGLAFAEASRWEEAITPLEAAAKVSVEHEEVRAIRLRLADCYLEMHRFEPAEKIVQQLLAADPRDTGLLARLDRAYTQSKQWEALASL